MLEVLSEVDHSHPTGTKLSLDPVAIRQCSLEALQQVGHRDGSRLATRLSYDLRLGRARSERTAEEQKPRTPLTLGGRTGKAIDGPGEPFDRGKSRTGAVPVDQLRTTLQRISKPDGRIETEVRRWREVEHRDDLDKEVEGTIGEQVVDTDWDPGCNPGLSGKLDARSKPYVRGELSFGHAENVILVNHVIGIDMERTFVHK
jgi:hypothetical protein